MDIELQENEIKFKYRVSGILIKDKEVLCVKINNNNFFCLPGGHVEVYENSQDAIVREFKEETDINVYVKKLLYVTENFFESNKYKCHELGFYYLLDTNEDLNNIKLEKIEQDNTCLKFEWIDISKSNIFKPEFLKHEKLDDLEANVQHIIIKNDKIIQKKS